MQHRSIIAFFRASVLSLHEKPAEKSGREAGFALPARRAIRERNEEMRKIDADLAFQAADHEYRR